ncbi:hypothetical protein Taro_036182 [Colocasia esculenta]|uniref:Uncharacterized protein n=1 Tax=Colocasia esculenta TaxID=4460 RepID=A0A843W7Q4_COLES|nr:hypothetical protein [Colocasia esculenta]
MYKKQKKEKKRRTKDQEEENPKRKHLRQPGGDGEGEESQVVGRQNEHLVLRACLFFLLAAQPSSTSAEQDSLEEVSLLICARNSRQRNCTINNAAFILASFAHKEELGDWAWHLKPIGGAC